MTHQHESTRVTLLVHWQCQFCGKEETTYAETTWGTVDYRQKAPSGWVPQAPDRGDTTYCSAACKNLEWLDRAITPETAEAIRARIAELKGQKKA